MAEEQVEGDASGRVARSRVRKIVRPSPPDAPWSGPVPEWERAGMAKAAVALFLERVNGSDPTGSERIALPGVYAITFAKCDRIKVGYATSILARLSEHQTSMPYPVELLMFTPGPPSDEGVLHERLAMYRRCGEWFEWTHAVGLYLQSHAYKRGGAVV